MARQFKGKLSAEDIAWLTARYPLSYVERMKALYGTSRGADSDKALQEAEEAARKAQEEADAAAAAAADEAQREADEAAAEAQRQAEEDLIGSTEYDVLGATEAEVKSWAESASDEEKAAALATEQGRTDREPRKGVVSLLS